MWGNNQPTLRFCALKHWTDAVFGYYGEAEDDASLTQRQAVSGDTEQKPR